MIYLVFVIHMIFQAIITLSENSFFLVNLRKFTTERKKEDSLLTVKGETGCLYLGGLSAQKLLFTLLLHNVTIFFVK